MLIVAISISVCTAALKYKSVKYPITIFPNFFIFALPIVTPEAGVIVTASPSKLLFSVDMSSVFLATCWASGSFVQFIYITFPF